jgi:hypothetical protein
MLHTFQVTDVALTFFGKDGEEQSNLARIKPHSGNKQFLLLYKIE